MEQKHEHNVEDIIAKSEAIANQLKLIANPLRLITLCSLTKGRKNVSELMAITGASQTLMSNHLSVLRKADIIDYERDHRTLNYFVKDERIKPLLKTICEFYCGE